MVRGGDDFDARDLGLPAPSKVTERVEALIERGLELYGRGELLAAIGDWEHALSLDPSAQRAVEYIRYVRENFVALEAHFRAAREAEEAARAAGLPVPDDPEVSGAYDLIELQVGAPAQELEPSTLPTIDEGWSLDDLAAPLPPPPVAPASPAELAISGTSLEDELAAVSAGLDLAQADDVATNPFNARMFADAPQGLAERETPAEGGAPASSGEVAVGADGGDGADEITVPGGEPPPPLAERPALSVEALEALGGKLPVVTIAPRRVDAGTDVGDLPAPPEATPPPEPDLDFDLGSLEGALPDDRAPADEAPAGLDLPLGADATEPVAETGDAYFSPEQTGEATRPAPRARVAASFLADEDFGTAERAVFAEEMPTIERGAIPGAIDLPDAPDLPAGIELGDASGLPPTIELGDEAELRGGGAGLVRLPGDADFDDGPETRERAAFYPRPAEPPREAPAVIVDEMLLREQTDAPAPAGEEGFSAIREPVFPANPASPGEGAALASASGEARASGAADTAFGQEGEAAAVEAAGALQATGSAEMAGTAAAVGAGASGSDSDAVPKDASAGDTLRDEPTSDEELIRRRIFDLLSLAREAAERGAHVQAVEAAEMALDEDPEGRVAPVILHRHRDLLYRIFEGHIGDMDQVPYVCAPLHQIAAEQLDHRTGFLLSRIDGMLTFEDILDIAGMPRLDAYRILSRLLRRGFIDVRRD